VNAYAVQYGKYVKIGKMVYVEGLLRANVTNNSNGTYDIGGLPFTVANTPNASGIIHAKEQNSWTVAPHHFSCMNNTTKARARGGIDVGDNSYSNANTSGFNSGSTNNNRVYVAGCYRAEG
jgi:single-stranded DNA-binding protein